MGTCDTMSRVSAASGVSNATSRSAVASGAGRYFWTMAAMIAIVTVLAYANSFAGVWLYDDFDSITGNPYIRRLWPLSSAMSRPLADSAETVSTRPLLSLTFALDYAMYGLDIRGFHATNLLIHVAAALILLAFLHRTIGLAGIGDERRATGLAAAMTLLWAVHPLHTSSVTYVVQRAESLGGLLLLATLYCAVRAPNGKRSAWSAVAVAAAVVGVAAKETVAVTPFLVVLHDGVFRFRSYRDAVAARWKLYLALAACWLPLVWLLSADTGELVTEGRGLQYAGTQPGVLLHYLRLAVWPRPLMMSYEWPLATSVADVALPGLVAGALLAVTLYGLARRQWHGFAGAWFFLVLAPSSSIFGLTQRIMEHRTYLPLVAPIALGVVAGERLLARAHRGRLVAALVCLYAALTLARNADYASETGFWRDNVVKRPQNYIAHLQLGRAQLRAGDVVRAEQSFSEAARLGPPFAPVYNDLGRVRLARGDLEGARTAIERALQLAPDLAVAHSNMGLLEERSGDLAAALASYRAALAADPALAVARENLARALALSGRIEEAVHEMARARGRAPDGRAWALVAQVLESGGRATEAEAAYRRAVADAPDDAIAHSALGTLLARQGRFDEAQESLESSLAIDPDGIDALRNLGALLAQRGKTSEAAAHFEHALAVDENARLAHFNLGLIAEERGDIDSARRHFRHELAIDPSFEPARRALARLDATGGDGAAP